MLKATGNFKYIVIITFIVCSIFMISIFNRESYSKYREEIVSFVESSNTIVGHVQEVMDIVFDTEGMSNDEKIKYTSVFSELAMSKLVQFHMQSELVEIPHYLPVDLTKMLKDAKQNLCDYIFNYIKALGSLKELCDTEDLKYKEVAMEWVQKAKEHYDSLQGHTEILLKSVGN